MPNIDLVCIECKNNFYFSEKDQAYYKQQNYQTPRRCYHCRKKRRDQSDQQGNR